MNVLAFAASNSRHSINAKLVRYTASRLVDAYAPDATIELVDLNDYEMPIFSIDRQNADGVPDAASTYFAKIGAADALIVSYAEHNGSYTAAWKNIFDWMSRIDARVFQDKPMIITATSPGQRGGSSVLNMAKSSAPFFGAEVIASVSIPKWTEAYDEDKAKLTRPDDVAAIDDAVARLVDSLA